MLLDIQGPVKTTILTVTVTLPAMFQAPGSSVSTAYLPAILPLILQ